MILLLTHLGFRRTVLLSTSYFIIYINFCRLYILGVSCKNHSIGILQIYSSVIQFGKQKNYQFGALQFNSSIVWFRHNILLIIFLQARTDFLCPDLQLSNWKKGRPQLHTCNFLKKCYSTSLCKVNI